MSALPFVFTSPYILFGLLALPAIWWLLRHHPAAPQGGGFSAAENSGHRAEARGNALEKPVVADIAAHRARRRRDFRAGRSGGEPRNNSIAGTGPLVLVVDNSWASATDWQRRVETAQALIGDAERADRPVSISFTADAEHDAVPATTAVALDKLAAAKPKPLAPDRVRTAEAITEALNGTSPARSPILPTALRPRRMKAHSKRWPASQLPSSASSRVMGNPSPPLPAPPTMPMR